MNSDQGEQTDKSHAIEHLAHELGMSIDVVAVIYGSELERLSTNAKFTAYISIFAFRNAREILRHSGTEKP